MTVGLPPVNGIVSRVPVYPGISPQPVAASTVLPSAESPCGTRSPTSGVRARTLPVPRRDGVEVDPRRRLLAIEDQHLPVRGKPEVPRLSRQVELRRLERASVDDGQPLPGAVQDRHEP